MKCVHNKSLCSIRKDLTRAISKLGKGHFSHDSRVRTFCELEYGIKTKHNQHGSWFPRKRLGMLHSEKSRGRGKIPTEEMLVKITTP